MAWLGTWANRRKISIAAADVTADLTDFPVRVSLSSLSGKGSDDVTGIFTEVGANSLKIAATKSDEITELYVEVEYWDSGSSSAELWIKVPSLLAASGGDIYLYYDNTKADNTTYVGVVGSISGETVWDNDFVCVMHLAETTGQYFDSTSNNNDTSVVDTTSRTRAGLVTLNSPDFDDATSDDLLIPAATELNVVDMTLEALVNPDDVGSGYHIGKQ